jgi:hypothetical protein
MSDPGEEYETEFGEFAEFDTEIETETKDNSEEFVEWTSLSDVDPTSSPIMERIRQSVVESRELAAIKR